MEEIQKLYDVLVRDGYYTKTLDEFNVQFQDPTYQDKVFNVVSRDGLYTKNKESFLKQYGLKKKEDTELPSPVGSLVQPEPVDVQEEIITAEQPEVVETTTIEKMAGDEPAATFFGDMSRAWKQGAAEAATVDDALGIFFKGKDVDNEDLDEYIEAVSRMDAVPESESMKSFYEVYEKEGKDLFAFIKAIQGNARVLPELFLSSTRAIINPASAAAAGASAAGGAAAGSVVPIIGTGLGAVGGAIAGMSGSLETALAVTEGLKKELAGKDFTRENIRKILEDPAALNRVRSRATLRGGVIGAVDALTLGLSGKLGVQTAKLTGKIAAKVGQEAVGKAVGATAGAGAGEMIGGAAGETLAQVATGDKLDAADIIFEGITGTVTAPLSVGKAFYSLPKYRIGDVKVTREKFIESINNATSEEILTMEVGVKNDEEVSALMNSKFKDATIERATKEVSPNINEEELAEIVELTKRKELLEANGGEVAKAELPQVNNRIKEITNAIQERSTEKVDVPKPTEDSTKVGEGDTEQEVARKDTSEGIQEEEVTVEDQKITQEADVTELTEDEKLEKVTKEKVKKLVTAPRRITDPFTVGQSQVIFNEDGTIKSIIKKSGKNKGQEVTPDTRSKVEKIILGKVIDVDAGEKAPMVEGLSPEQVADYVVENSNNVREVAETIEYETNRYKSLLTDEQIELLDPFEYRNIPIPLESWKTFDDVNNLTPQIKRNWIKKEATPLDTKVKELPNYTEENARQIINDIIEFAKNNPSGTVSLEKGKTPALLDLETKFKELTGINPTPTNIDLVIGIEEGRVPAELLKLQEQQKLLQPTIDEKGEVVEGGAFGKKKGPRAEKIVAPAKKEITVDEAKALKDQIRLEARAAREAKLDIKNKRAAINDLIKDFKGKAQITANQAGVLTRKINTLNVDNETKVEEFLEYTEKIVRNAELAEKINKADALRKTAKKNIIKGKIGTAKDLFPALESLFNIKIQAIPLDKIDSYLELAEAFGERKSVLTLPEKGLALQQADDILNSIEDEAQITDDAKVKEDDYNLKEEIDNIVNNRIEVPTLIEPEKVIADYLNSLSKEDIEGLVTEKDGKKNYSQVEKLKNVLSNIENGYVPKAASELAINIEASRKNKIISPVIGKLKFNVLEQGIEKAIAKAKAGLISRKRDVIGKQIGAVPLTNIDEALGNFNKKDIARETFDYLASEYSKYEVALGKIDNILSEAEALLTQGKRGRFSKRLLNQSMKAKYKIMAYQLQREYESNGGKKGTAPALDFINATVDAIKSEEQNFLKNNDVKILEEIKKEFIADGKIDNNKILNSLSPREKKALSLIDQANQSLAEKALFTSAVLRGNRVNLFSNYVHHDVIMKNEDDVKKMLDNKRERMTKPSTKSKTLLERTPGAKPISFDPISSAGRAAKETLLDFHMTQPIRIVNKTLSNVIETIESDPNSTKLQRGTAKAVKDAFEEINSIIFDNTYQEIGVADKFLEKAKKLGYYSALASLPRAGAELGSNLSFALLSNPQGLAAGIKNYGKYSMGAEGAQVLDAIGSSQTLKLYNKEALTGKLADTNLYQRGKDKRGKAVNPVSETINYLYNNLPIVKGPVEATKFVSENLISTPDKAISRPLYFDTFVRAFAEATKKSGKEIKLTSEDFKNIDDYVAKYPDEIKEAREKADDENIRMATTVNPYSGILKLQPKKNDKTRVKIYKQANGYMARFTLFEYSTFRKAVRALYTDGEISKSQAAGLIAGSVARMTSYMILYQFLNNMFDTVIGGLFGLDVEEEEDELENQLKRQLIGTGSTLILRRAVGNIPAIPISLGIELLNEQYGEDLRGGEEYDEFENSLVFSQIGLNELKKAPVEVLLTKSFAGPYTPLLRSLSRGVKVAQGLTGSAKEETKQKYMDELTGRMALEAAGNVGLLPFYKDVRRILLKDMFKDKPKTSGKGSKYTEKDFKNAKGNPAKQKYIRERINSQKNTNKKFSKPSIPGAKK